MVAKNPEILKSGVCHVEFGGLASSSNVEISTDSIIIS